VGSLRRSTEERLDRCKHEERLETCLRIRQDRIAISQGSCYRKIICIYPAGGGQGGQHERIQGSAFASSSSIAFDCTLISRRTHSSFIQSSFTRSTSAKTNQGRGGPRRRRRARVGSYRCSSLVRTAPYPRRRDRRKQHGRPCRRLIRIRKKP